MDTVTNKLSKNNKASKVIFVDFKKALRNRWDKSRRYGI